MHGRRFNDSHGATSLQLPRDFGDNVRQTTIPLPATRLEEGVDTIHVSYFRET
jgi:hypothetical protein